MSMLNWGQLRYSSQLPKCGEQATHGAHVVGPVLAVHRGRSGSRGRLGSRGWWPLGGALRQRRDHRRDRCLALPRCGAWRRPRSARQRQGGHLAPAGQRWPVGLRRACGHRRHGWSLLGFPWRTVLTCIFLRGDGRALSRDPTRTGARGRQCPAGHSEVRPRAVQPQIDQQRSARSAVELTYQVVRAPRGDDQVVELVAGRRGEEAGGGRTPAEHRERHSRAGLRRGSGAVQHLSGRTVGYAGVIRSRYLEQFLEQLAEHQKNGAMTSLSNGERAVLFGKSIS